MSAEIASLSFSVDSSPLAQASTRLDQLGQSAQGAGSKTSQLLSATDALIAALNRNTAAADALTAQLGQVQAAGTRTSQALQQVGTASNAATSNVVQLTNATGQARAGFDAAAAAATRLRTAWAELSSQGAATLQNLERMQKLAASSASTPGFSPAANSNGPGGGPAGHGGGNYRDMILQNILFQGKDFLEQTMTGGSPLRAAMTQAPQVAALMQMGNLSPGDVVKGLGSQASGALSGLFGFLSSLSPATLAIGALATAAATAGAALSSYRDQQKELQLSVSGRGRASGATVGDINRVALAGAQGAGVSVGDARDMVAQYADTGRIGTEMYSGLLKMAQDYAVTTRQELPDANKALAAAFADPIKGAQQLNAETGFLTAGVKEQIEAMQQSGDRLGAQKVLLDALGTSLLSARDRMGFFARQWQDFKNTTAGEFDAIGRVVNRVLTGGDLETQIETARKVLETSKARQGGLFGTLLPGTASDDIEKAQAQLDVLLQKQKAIADANKQSQLGQRGLEVDALVKAANPDNERAQQLERNAANIKKYLDEAKIDANGEAGNTMRGFEVAAKHIREDLAAGGSELAAGLRRAQFDASQVGRSDTSQNEAQIRFNAAEEKRKIEKQNREPRDRNPQLNAIDTRVRLQLETLQRQTVINSSSGSSSYAIGLGQAPEKYRDLYYNAAQAQGLNPDLLVSMARRESSFNPNARSPVGAEGIAQFMPATRRGLGDFNPWDPAQAIPKQAELMRQLMDRYGNNETAAIVGYNAGPKVADRFVASHFDTSVIPKETRDYLKAILTPAPNAKAAVEAASSRDKQLEEQKSQVDTASQYLGRNNVAYETQIKYQRDLADAMSRNVPITDEYKASLLKAAEASAVANRQLSNIRANNDIRMGDEQMGRDRYTAQAYSSAQSYYQDTSTGEAQTYISRKRDQLQVQDAKQTLQDASTGFVEALSKGTNAASAFSNALSKIGDKLISGAMDSLFASAFKGIGSSGGIGGLLGGLLPSGGLFANGGIMTTRGPVQLRTYANGGVANSPQLAVYGEGSSPEAYVPLPDGKRIPVAMQVPANGNAPSAAGGAMSQVNVYAPGSTMSPGEFEGIARKAIAENNVQQRQSQFARAAVDRRAFG